MKLKKFLYLFLEDFLILAGCICILIGLSMWNAVITWIVAGLMLIGVGFIFAVGKARLKNDSK